MPPLKDWLQAALFILVFFLAQGLCDPARGATFEGAAFDQERTMDRYLTESEQDRLLLTLKERAAAYPIDRRDAAFFRMLLHSGMRIGEASRLTVGQALDAFATGYLFIPREHRKGKTRDHRVFVTEALRTDLKDLLKARHEIVEADGHVADPLMVGRSGEAMTVRALQMRFKYWAKLAGLPNVSPHWLRHTRAMNIMRHSSATDPRGVVQSVLAHATIRSTGIYTGTPREDVEAALTEIDGRQGRVTRAQLRRDWEGRV